MNQTPLPGLYLGMMSGTSCDGLDIAFVKEPESKVEFATTAPFPPLLQEQLLALSDPGWKGHTSHLAKLHFDFPKWAATEIERLCLTYFHSTPQKLIRAIGFPGHTLAHNPPDYTYQIGNPAILANLTGVPVISDFRSPDILFGGQGAPLLGVYHQKKFEPHQPCLVQNIGGIGNLTLVSTDVSSSPPLSFDTGPGNMLIDQAALLISKGELHFDNSGKFASSGKINHSIIKKWLKEEEDYSKRPPPKSTGKERYGHTRFKQMLSDFRDSKKNINQFDFIATLTEFTASTIRDQIERFIPKNHFKTLFACGGGASNPFLMSRLKNDLPEYEVKITDEVGVSSSSLEAEAFAYFSYLSLNQIPIDFTPFTGSRQPTIAGSVSYPNHI